MPRKLNDFYNKVSKTGLRFNYQFEVNIIDGDSVSTRDEEGGNDLRDIEFFASSSQLPGKTIEPVEVQYYGTTFRLPGVQQFDGNISMSLKCDSEMKLRTSIETWMNKYSDLHHSGGGNKKMPNYYMYIDLLDHDLDNILATYKVMGIFPSELGAIELSHEDTGVSVFDLSVSYQYWFLDKIGAAAEFRATAEPGDGDPLGAK